MTQAMEKFLEILYNFNFISALDVFFIAVVFFSMFYIAKKYNSSFLVQVTLIILIVGFVTNFFAFPVSSVLTKVILLMMPLIYIIVFRSELKREVWKLSRGSSSSEIAVSKFSGSEKEIAQCIQIIIKALQSMSKRNVGALIVIIPSKIPMQIAESGVFMNADLSTEIIENIFTPNTPLHDGAMLITGNKILASGCFLPLTQDTNLPKDLGTRHRAGIGITEMTDVLSLIVSEETGVISIVRRGVIKRYADAQMLTNAMEQIYGIKEYNSNEKK
ncbi:MAG: diadenylate cyclase [Clostridia bacterium]